MTDYEKVKRLIDPILAADRKLYEAIMQLIPEYYKPQEELTNRSPKYIQGQEVWSYTHGHINKWRIEQIRWDADAEDFRLDLSTQWGKGSLLESQLHATEEELIEAQLSFWCSKMDMIDEIKFWAKRSAGLAEENPCDHLFVLLQDDPECIKCGVAYAEEDCEHENDGMVYCSNPPQNKCKKCGEFYR